MDPEVMPPAAKANKPKWLRRMERESWQPELIISGVAILGSLQLPQMLNNFEHYALLRFDRDTIFLAYIAVIYWRILAVGLIFTFIFHFIVRALWIGLIGLNSVYPGGFKPNQKFSEHYQERMRAEYGDIDGFINRLDRLGSGIFGVAFGIAGTFTNFGLIALLLVFIHSWLMEFDLDPAQVLFILGLLFVPLMVLSLVVMISHTKSLRERAWVKRWQWPATKLMSRITYPVARRYITTCTNLVTSYYADSKAFTLAFIGGMAIIVVAGMASVFTSQNIPLFIDKVYHRLAADSTRLPDRYPTEEPFAGVYYSPQLIAASATGNGALRVWIPLPEREAYLMDKNCSLPEVPRSDSDAVDWRNDRRGRTIACAREYLNFSVNGSSPEDASIRREYRINAAGEQFGVVVQFTGVTLRPGHNLLEVSAAYPHEDTGEPRLSYLTFYLDA